MLTKSGVFIGVLAAALMTAVAAHAQDPPRADGWVVLSLDEYRALRARAFPTTPDPLPPPVDATLTRVDYNLQVNGDTVTGEARLTIDVLKQGWVTIQMPAGLLVRGARLDGRPSALVDGTPPRVLISRSGRAVLALDVVVPVEAASGIESMTLPPSGSAVSAVSLTVPRTGLDLTVAGGFVAEQRESAAENRWTVYGSPARPLTFSWRRRVDDRRATLPLRSRARITQLVVLGEDSTQITASLRVEIVQGVAREIELTTPAGVAVNQVSGATVGEWRHEGGTLTVSFLEPIVSSTSIVISAEARTPREGAITVPLVRMPAAERETGGVAVDVVGAGEIKERQPRGFDPIDASDLGDILEGRESPSMVAFGFKPMAGSAPRTLAVTVSRYLPQAVLVANVEEARYEALIAEDGKMLVRARYAVRNNQRAFLALKLPAGSVLWSAALAGRPVRPGVSADGGYLLPLVKGRAGEQPPTFAVDLIYLLRGPAWSDKGEARMELPAADLPVSRTGLLVHHSPRFAIEPQPGAFRSESNRDPWTATLRNEIPVQSPTAAATPAPPAGAAGGERDGGAARALLDRYRQEMGKSAAGVIPVHVTVPALGPSFFVAAELTAESQAPFLDVKYVRTGK
jgi:hypothetical protein